MLPKTFLIAILAAGISSVTCIRLKTAKSVKRHLVFEWKELGTKIDLEQEFDRLGLEIPENESTFWVGTRRPKDTETTSSPPPWEGLRFFEKESDADEFVRWSEARTNAWFVNHGFALHDDREGGLDAPGEEPPEPEGISQDFAVQVGSGWHEQENLWNSEWKFACLRGFKEPDTDDEN